MTTSVVVLWRKQKGTLPKTRKEDDAMGKTMTPSDVAITAGQIGKVQEILGARLRKSGLPSNLVQEVLMNQGDAVADEMVAVLRTRVEKLGAMVIRPVTVDYSRTLEDMIAAGHYNYVNERIIPRNFPLTGEGQVELDLCLVHFNRDITSEEAIKELEKMGMRPATLPELLALGEKYPEEQRQHPIIALGNVWRCPFGHRHVPFLARWRDKRKLRLSWFDGSWSASCRFLAVRA